MLDPFDLPYRAKYLVGAAPPRFLNLLHPDGEGRQMPGHHVELLVDVFVGHFFPPFFARDLVGAVPLLAFFCPVARFSATGEDLGHPPISGV